MSNLPPLWSTWSHSRALIDAGRPFKIRKTYELPWILAKVESQFPLVVDHELGGGVYNSVALLSVAGIQINFAGTQIECLGLGVCPSFTEGNLAVGDEANSASRWGWNTPDKTNVESESASE